MHRLTTHKTLWSFALLAALVVFSNGCDSEVSSSTSPDLAPAGSSWDEYPPAAPAGLEVITASDAGFRLTWDSNSEGDLAGYKLYVYSPSPYRTNAYICAHGGEVIAAGQTNYSYSGDTSTGMHYFWVTAVDTDGNESVGCYPIEFCYYGDDSEMPGADRDGGLQEEGGLGWGEDPNPANDGREDAEEDGGNFD